jgi:hypothetical protein
MVNLKMILMIYLSRYSVSKRLFTSRKFSLQCTLGVGSENPVPQCKNCIFFRPYWMISHIDEDLSECVLFGQRESPNSKYFIYNECVYKCRSDESLCGKNGTFFIKNNSENETY